jgi:endonuclease/exonuclease/phosphatase family metal-dependent hydrolase
MKKGFVFLVVVNVIAFFAGSSEALDYGVPQKTDDNIIVASYNIKWLGQSRHDLDRLATVIRNFDVCGILEVKNEAEVSKLAKALDQKTGKDWGYVYGIRTHRPGGRYHEAYAVVWCRERVQLGNGVISNFWDMEEAYRNDPYIVSFKRKGFDFSLALVHTRWGVDPEGDRESEVLMLAEHITWLRSFLEEKDFILAGDFNYPGTNQAMVEMADNAGLVQIDSNAKSTFKTDGSGYASSYDHIYISETDTAEFIQGQCALLDATKYIFGDNSTDHMKKSRKELSDHLPVWAVFDVTAPDDD